MWFKPLFTCIYSLYMYVTTQVPWCICGGQRTAFKSQFSPSTRWVLRIRPVLSGLVTVSLPTEPFAGPSFSLKWQSLISITKGFQKLFKEGSEFESSLSRAVKLCLKDK